MTVTEARRHLTRSVLHAEPDVFCAAKLDEALQDTFEDFHRRSECQMGVASITLAADTAEYDLTTAVGGSFLPSNITGPAYLTAPAGKAYRGVYRRSFDNVRDELERNVGVTATPEIYAFAGGPETFTVFPTPDQEYTLKFRYWETLDRWEPGIQGVWDTATAYTRYDVVQGDGTPDALFYIALQDNSAQEPNGDDAFWQQITPASASIDPDSFEINIPRQYVGSVIRWGARSALLYGAPGHPDDQAAAYQYEQLARSAYKKSHASGAHITKRDRDSYRGFTSRMEPI